ncbi:MAG TPA: hypothetical protein VKT70_02025 [Stellaceae bacterium]|nr:hypothetical protein [Stellaceae bacterium]
MSMRRQKSRSIASWLAIVALTVQGLLPFLLNWETAHEPTAETRLAVAGAPHQHQHGDGKIGHCPICLALHTAALTATLPPAPDLTASPPPGRPSYRRADSAEPISLPSHSYEARGPPDFARA